MCATNIHVHACISDASEVAQAKMKGLDHQPGQVSNKSGQARPHKDVNTFINNQLKFVGGSTTIPPEHMKCNILKAKAQEEMKKSKLPWL